MSSPGNTQTIRNIESPPVALKTDSKEMHKNVEVFVSNAPFP